MELQSYLRPDEYILSVIRDIRVEGTYKNLAITNKRFILFNTKRRFSILTKGKEEVSDIRSVSFENAPAVMLTADNDYIHRNL